MLFTYLMKNWGGGVYNMGVSGHHFFKVCQYLPANIKLYHTPPKVIVIETDSVTVTEQDKDAVLQSSVEYTPSHAKGIIGMIQKIPFCRMLYSQMESGLLDLFLAKNNNPSADIYQTNGVSDIQTIIDQNAYDELFAYLASLEAEYGTQILICYHPTGKLQEDGTIEFKRTKELEAFSKTAVERGIDFIDLTDAFEKLYYKDHKVAHGFVTGKVESGHLNASGHAAMAEALYEKIIQIEQERMLCR